jgi:hypothetical protein
MCTLEIGLFDQLEDQEEQARQVHLKWAPPAATVETSQQSVCQHWGQQLGLNQDKSNISFVL